MNQDDEQLSSATFDQNFHFVKAAKAPDLDWTDRSSEGQVNIVPNEKCGVITKVGISPRKARKAANLDK